MPKTLTKVIAHDNTKYHHYLLQSIKGTMPKKHSKADQRKRLYILAKRQCISVGELRNRLKSDGDSAAHHSQDDVLVSHDTSNENSPSTVEEQGESVT
jgi:hypothetical protein